MQTQNSVQQNLPRVRRPAQWGLLLLGLTFPVKRLRRHRARVQRPQRGDHIGQLGQHGSDVALRGAVAQRQAQMPAIPRVV